MRFYVIKLGVLYYPNHTAPYQAKRFRTKRCAMRFMKANKLKGEIKEFVLERGTKSD